jgi:hypothetical protein
MMCEFTRSEAHIIARENRILDLYFTIFGETPYIYVRQVTLNISSLSKFLFLILKFVNGENLEQIRILSAKPLATFGNSLMI